ncbi:unnamed protein product [Mytilus coruscus]|uniref:Mab-21-like nucleotidyltransferase domain-containing protein n=1 Tax=Mytilus coruscus TaxID=42192 RepID=A0A6J8ECS6_MYTCO|nr:unnamed protein product [Mytilus coruscus]
MIQCYAPTKNAEEDEKECHYEKLQHDWDNIPKIEMKKIVMGDHDMNAKIGKKNKDRERTIGKPGLGKINENEEKLVEFCEMNELVIGNNMSNLDTYIQNLHDQQCIFQIPKNEVKEIERFIIHIVKDFIPTTIKALNPNFTVLEVVNAGSYFEHTKVKNPDEFDFMVVLRELSTPVSVQIQKGCMPGYANVKLRQKGRWHSSWVEYTQEKEFEISILSFNAFLREAVSLVPVQKGRYGTLICQDVTVRGKPYSEFSHVQTANLIWKRKQCSAGEEIAYQRFGITKKTDNENVKICVDMMTCCHFPVEMFSEILPTSSLSNPSLIKHGCHIVLKPCNTSSCNEKETPCRLISYTKSEIEKMANLDENWKVIYKCTKLLFSYVEYSGIDSYKLKSTVLHLSAKHGHIELGRGLILVLKSLQISSSKGFLSCYFNSTLNIWSISLAYRYITKWQIILLFKIFRVFEKIPAGESQQLLLSKMINQWIICTCRHSIEVSQIRSNTFDENSLATFNVQGNIFLEIVNEMEPIVKAQKPLNLFYSMLFVVQFTLLVVVIKYASGQTCLSNESKEDFDKSRKALTDEQENIGKVLNKLENDNKKTLGMFKETLNTMGQKIKKLDTDFKVLGKDFRTIFDKHFFLEQRKCREIGGYIVKIDDENKNSNIEANRANKNLKDGEWLWTYDQLKAGFTAWYPGYSSKGTASSCVLLHGSRTDCLTQKQEINNGNIIQRRYNRMIRD